MKFTITSESSTGLIFNTKEEFLKYIEDLIDEAEKNDVEYFDIEIDME